MIRNKGYFQLNFQPALTCGHVSSAHGWPVTHVYAGVMCMEVLFNTELKHQHEKNNNNSVLKHKCTDVDKAVVKAVTESFIFGFCDLFIS